MPIMLNLYGRVFAGAKYANRFSRNTRIRIGKQEMTKPKKNQTKEFAHVIHVRFIIEYSKEGLDETYVPGYSFTILFTFYITILSFYIIVIFFFFRNFKTSYLYKFSWNIFNYLFYYLSTWFYSFLKWLPTSIHNTIHFFCSKLFCLHFTFFYNTLRENEYSNLMIQLELFRCILQKLRFFPLDFER